MYKPIVKNLLFPLAELFQKLSISEKYNFLKNSDNWSREKIVNYQTYKLKKLLVRF